VTACTGHSYVDCDSLHRAQLCWLWQLAQGTVILTVTACTGHSSSTILGALRQIAKSAY